MKRTLTLVLILLLAVMFSGCDIIGNKYETMAKKAFTSIGSNTSHDNIFIIQYTSRDYLCTGDISNNLFNEIPVSGICILFSDQTSPSFHTMKAAFLDQDGETITYTFDYGKRYSLYEQAVGKRNYLDGAGYLADCNYMAQALLDGWEATTAAYPVKNESRLSVPAKIEYNTWYSFSNEQKERIISK